MSGASNYLETAILQLIKDSTPYVALFNGDPLDDGSGGTELTSTLTGAANRLAVTFGSIAPSGADMAMSNTGVLTIAASAAAPAVATHFAIFDAITGGNLLVSEELTANKNIDTNDPVLFAIGALVIKGK